MAKKKRRKSAVRNILMILIVILMAAVAGLVWVVLNMDTAPAPEASVQAAAVIAEPVTEETVTEPVTTEPETTEPETTMPEPVHVVSRATIVSTGDLLMHGQLINDARQDDGSYDFSYIFPHVKDAVTVADFAVANLETTLGGTAQPYQGNPMFNCPDEIVDAARDAGFDLLLTVNNHSYDTHQAGYERTIRVVREKGLLNLGTRLSAEEPRYQVVDINGIKVGMIAYTYEDSQGTGNPPALNYNPMQSNGYEILNCFRQGDTEPFYRELEEQLALMKANGAEATIVYLHWGQEYYLNENATQDAIAQRLCDMGVDVIIGGHPHVIQPAALLTSTVDPNHRTVVVYSLGNAVSNQRLGKLSNVPSAHTEDGLLFYVTFSKYSDGRVFLESTAAEPTWVRAIDINGNTVVRDSATIRRYEILPLDLNTRDQWKELYGLDDSTLQQLTDSYDRTMKVLNSSNGMTEITSYLAAEQIARETDYALAVQSAA